MLKREIALLFIKRNGFSLVTARSRGAIVFPFVEGVVRDFDVVKPDKFEVQLTSFFAVNKIPPLAVAILLPDDVVFQKEIVAPGAGKEKTTPPQSDSSVEVKDQEAQFLDTIPFEDIASRSYQAGGIIRIIATNRGMFDHIRNVFEQNKSTIEAIVPLTVLFGAQSAQFSLNTENIKQLTQKLEVLKQQSLPLQKKEDTQKTEEITPYTLTLTKGVNIKRLVILVSIFILLLAIMGYMIYASSPTLTSARVVPHAIKRSNTSQINVTSPSLSPAPSVSSQTLQSSPSAALIARTRIRIITSSQSDQKVTDLEKSLQASGFTIINVTTQTGSVSKPTIIFSQSLTVSIRNILLHSIQPVIPELVTQETNDVLFDATIIII